MLFHMAKLSKRPSRVREHIDILKYLQKISPQRQKTIIKAADRPILEALSEIALNLIKKNIHLSPSQIEKLKPFEEQIYQLSLRSHSVSKKRRILQKGGFIGTLLGSVLPILISSIITASSK